LNYLLVVSINVTFFINTELLTKDAT